LVKLIPSDRMDHLRFIGVRNKEWEFIVNPIVDGSIGALGEATFAPADIDQRFMLQERSHFQALSKHSFGPIRCHLLSLGADMRRREFLGALSGAAAAWPVVAWAH